MKWGCGPSASAVTDKQGNDYVAQTGHREALRRCCGCGTVARRRGARGRADEHRRAGLLDEHRWQAHRSRSGLGRALHQDARTRHSDAGTAPPPHCRADGRMSAGRPGGHRGRCQHAGRRRANLLRRGRMSADRAGRLYARAAAAPAPDFGRRRAGRRLGWRLWRRVRRRRRLWWRLLRRLLRRRRVVLRRCRGFDYHHQFGRRQHHDHQQR